MATNYKNKKTTGGAVNTQNDAETLEPGESVKVGDQIQIAPGVFAEVVESDPAHKTAVLQQQTYPPRNIKYIGRVRKNKQGKIFQNDAPITRTTGADKIELPTASEQIEKRIFWHDRAGDIVKLFPHLYKLVVSGKKHPRSKRTK